MSKDYMEMLLQDPSWGKKRRREEAQAKAKKLAKKREKERLRSLRLQEEKPLEEHIQEDLNPDDFISKPFLSKNCTIRNDFLGFDYSFGYDCKQYYNLVMLEENVLAFYSGNLLHFFNTETREIWFRRSAGGSGIGHIATNPHHFYNHLAVAENGNMPLIIIYKWPTFGIISLLEGGTQKTYSFINYSPDGKLLCSQGGEPDYQITVWDWYKSHIILRCQSNINDVYVVKFSSTVPGTIITGGVGHIKFWKMASTFTGLKLMGVPGRFGKTEMCDIIGFYSLPDGKLCMDGYVNLWYFPAIDNANPPEDYPYVEIEPINEIKIENEENCASIMAMIKVHTNPEDQEYYCQDGNGGIWRYEIIPKNRPPPIQLFTCHAGPVMDMAASPVDEHIATLGKDGRIFIYNYIEKKIIDNTGKVMLAGFSDGILRVLVLSLKEIKRRIFSSTHFINVIQAIKVHDKAITAMSINNSKNLLVTGSKEARIFVFHFKKEFNRKHISLVPIGFVPVASGVTFLNWKPSEDKTLMVCCEKGELLEMTLPDSTRTYTKLSYNLTEVVTKTITFLVDSESEEELDPIYIPEEPNPILFCMYTPRNTIWLSMGGYDAGFIYEYVMDKNEVIKCTDVKDAYDVEINTYLYSHKKEYLILGMNDGCIRVNRVNPDDFTDLSNYWLFSMHDNVKGRIRRICFNKDHHYMFTCGDDGNIFSFRVNFDDEQEYITTFEQPTIYHGLPVEEIVKDIVSEKALSLEGKKVKAEHDRKMQIINLNKKEVLDKLDILKQRYIKVVSRNQRLIPSQIIPKEMFEIHPDITEELNNKLQDEIDLVKRKLAFDVEKSTLALHKVQDYYLNVLETLSFYVISIRNNEKVSSFRLRKLPEEFNAAKIEAKIKLEELEKKGRGPELHVVHEEAAREAEVKVPLMELFLRSNPSIALAFKSQGKRSKSINVKSCYTVNMFFFKEFLSCDRKLYDLTLHFDHN
ncbi:hypothetical protein L9F63_000820, partial [Diploptera punctata]